MELTWALIGTILGFFVGPLIGLGIQLLRENYNAVKQKFPLEGEWISMWQPSFNDENLYVKEKVKVKRKWWRSGYSFINEENSSGYKWEAKNVKIVDSKYLVGEWGDPDNEQIKGMFVLLIPPKSSLFLFGYTFAPSGKKNVAGFVMVKKEEDVEKALLTLKEATDFVSKNTKLINEKQHLLLELKQI